MEGSEVALFVPNEHVEFGDGTQNAFEATVTDTISTGSYSEYAGQLDYGREFRAHRTPGDSLLREGSTTTIGSDPANARFSLARER